MPCGRKHGGASSNTFYLLLRGRWKLHRPVGRQEITRHIRLRADDRHQLRSVAVAIRPRVRVSSLRDPAAAQNLKSFHQLLRSRDAHCCVGEIPSLPIVCLDIENTIRLARCVIFGVRLVEVPAPCGSLASRHTVVWHSTKITLPTACAKWHGRLRGWREVAHPCLTSVANNDLPLAHSKRSRASMAGFACAASGGGAHIHGWVAQRHCDNLIARRLAACDD